MTIKLPLIACLLVAGRIAPSQAQRPVTYAPFADTLTYRSENAYLMWFLRGSDTLGEPSHSWTRERVAAVRTGADLQVDVTLSGEPPSTFSSSERYTVSPLGRVLSVNGIAVGQAPNARVDLFTRLPEGGFIPRVGKQWADSVRVTSALPYGQTYYRASRRYTVARVIDTLNTTIALLVSSGRMALRQGGWQDSTAGTVWWQEVEGPVIDSIWFDTVRGVVAGDASRMDLIGQAGFGQPKTPSVLKSGLRSLVRRIQDNH